MLLVVWSGLVVTVAGSGTGTFADGSGTAASLWSPRGIHINQAGVLTVADYGNHRIRSVKLVDSCASGSFYDGATCTQATPGIFTGSSVAI